tara:strand:+ start:404 stop:724 length:321 start_codon:yes stop_codon:yes gene_type:complete
MTDKEQIYFKDELDYFIHEYKKNGRLLNEQIIEITPESYQKKTFFDVLYRFPSIYIKKENSGSDNDHVCTYFVSKIDENKYYLRLCMIFTEANTGYVGLSFSPGHS